jgi:hypothetical protein
MVDLSIDPEEGEHKMAYLGSELHPDSSSFAVFGAKGTNDGFGVVLKAAHPQAFVNTGREE